MYFLLVKSECRIHRLWAQEVGIVSAEYIVLTTQNAAVHKVASITRTDLAFFHTIEKFVLLQSTSKKSRADSFLTSSGSSQQK